MIDLKKEQEAFESYAQKFFKTDKAFEKKGNQYIYDEVVMMWDCWIAKQLEIDEPKAKLEATQAPEGFVLVPKDKLLQIIGSASILKPITSNPLMQKYELEVDFIIDTTTAMIEAAQGEGHE
ncbi:hypothetical protein ACX1NX_03085 [Acinetobacter sp. ANC 5383]